MGDPPRILALTGRLPPASRLRLQLLFKPAFPIEPSFRAPSKFFLPRWLMRHRRVSSFPPFGCLPLLDPFGRARSKSNFCIPDLLCYSVPMLSASCVSGVLSLRSDALYPSFMATSSFQIPRPLPLFSHRALNLNSP